VSSQRLEDGILVVLTGDIDLATASIAEDELRRAEHSENLVVLDLGRVTFIDSTGLRMVIAADQRLRERHGSLEITRVPRHVQQLFELVGISEHLNIVDGKRRQLLRTNAIPHAAAAQPT
jgi:anti-anti-sigma factor